jgi:hypothetical protein
MKKADFVCSKRAKIRTIFRQLTPENKVNLLAWVHLACFAENSAKKTLGISAVVDSVSISKPQEYSGGNLLQRSKK